MIIQISHSPFFFYSFYFSLFSFFIAKILLLRDYSVATRSDTSRLSMKKLNRIKKFLFKQKITNYFILSFLYLFTAAQNSCFLGNAKFPGCPVYEEIESSPSFSILS